MSLSWTANSEPDISGYKVYWGNANNYPYGNSLDVGNVTSYTITGLPAGTFYANVTAYDISADTVTDNPNTIVNEKQCTGNESWYAKPISSVGIHESDLTSKNILFNFYPNPANDLVTLNITNTNIENMELNIYNVIGVLVKSEKINQNQQQINIGNLSNGIYLLEIKSQDWMGKEKLIIKR